MKYKEFKFEVGQKYTNSDGNICAITHVGERLCLYKSEGEEYSVTKDFANLHWEEYVEPKYHVAYRFSENYIADPDWQISNSQYKSVDQFLRMWGESNFEEVILLKSKED